jgi:DNA-binding YbaB/EbfC family protein
VQPNMKMLQQMQQRIMKMQEELENTTVEGTAGGGAVTVTVSGLRTVKGVKITPEAVDPNDVEMLEDMILSAIQEAMSKAEEMANQKMGAITGGLHIPGLM